MSNKKHLLSIAENWINEGKSVVIASVIKTWGSAPSIPGSQMIISNLSEIEGSVSGGCVEGLIINHAFEIFENSKPKLIEFGVSNEKAWEVGLACGGKIQIYIEKIEN